MFPAVAAIQLGNRCGHNPHDPRFFIQPPRWENKRFPKIITAAKEKLQEYFTRRALMPTLNQANSSDREQRSERAEACILMAQVLISHLDLATLRVIRPGEDGISGIRMQDLAAEAGLNLRRAERAYSDLVKAGIVKTHPIAEKQEDGSFIGYAAIRTISQHLFGILGLRKWLDRERHKAGQRAKRKNEPTTGRAAIALAMQAAEIEYHASGLTGMAAVKAALHKKPPPDPDTL